MESMSTRAITPDAEGEWRPAAAYSLAQTLGVLQRGTHDPTVRVGDSSAWLCFRHDGGPVTLRLDLARDPAPAHGDPAPALLRWRAWGEGAQHDGFADAVVRLAGGADDWSVFDAGDFPAALPPIVQRARRAHPGLRLPATGRVFDALVPVVLEQKVTTIEARFAWRYLAGRFGDAPPSPASGPGDSVLPAGLRLPPTPAQIRRIPSWEWHAARVDSARSRTLLRAAESAAGLDRLARSTLDDRPGRALQSLPGIGPWTAAEVLQRSHGDPDSVSVGDFHLSGFVGEALTGSRTDDVGMLDLLRPWHGHRQRVVRMIAASGFRKQAHGPRLAPRDYRRF
ncbi:DNA-3-methyladenine glycosylase family protein [Zhihengliuella salsuginis]|uniref:3-methyladenine DNA glycosylase/8-oxoguanine DNA glycosylase n=1 Tax=Zhihengliuella salsuginis TaxID=578222 RepID=A0ABQ3GKM8_9MICC|nr:3-methyladenine DNA glycosylase [Zhihengliuella salsuginis]GHD10124.1 hypothetical protein GCM10008096_23350 [Zhihengliuella salsuginis]